MDSKTLSKYRLFGKAGKIVMTVLAVIAALITVCCCIATVFVATLPENALTVCVTEHAELRFNSEHFGTLWSILGGSFTYTGASTPDYVLEGSKKHVTPPENQRFETELKFFDRSYDSAEIRTDGSEKVIQAEASPSKYNVKNLVKVFAFATLFAASAAASLWMLRRLFATLAKSDSPFCGEVVAKLRGFGFSLLPVALFSSVAQTLFDRFLSAGKSVSVSIQWGVLIAFVVTMALVAVFRYGVLLQKESDETL